MALHHNVDQVLCAATISVFDTAMCSSCDRLYLVEVQGGGFTVVPLHCMFLKSQFRSLSLHGTHVFVCPFVVFQVPGIRSLGKQISDKLLPLQVIQKIMYELMNLLC